MRHRNGTFPIAGVLFFLSGALGLGYELVWIRKAALVVGASQAALTTVLTAFFLGLALGSRFFGHHVRSRQWSPLVVYGVLEVAVGLHALALPELFAGIETVYGLAYGTFAGSTLGLATLRFTLLLLLFLVPTFFMGGTLPLLLDGLVSSDRTIGSTTSLLYGLNILGAVFGVLATAYIAIPLVGLDGTSRAGGVGNLLIGLAAIAWFRRARPLHETIAAAPCGRFFPAAAAASGFLAIAYQICWARYFTLFNFNSVYLIAILLAVYLLALAVGSLLLAPLLHARWSPLRILAVVQAAIPLVVLALWRAWRLAEYRFELRPETVAAGRTRPSITMELAHDSPHFWHFFNETADAIFFAPLFQVALVLLVPVMLIGTGLPGLIAAAVSHHGDLRAMSGRLVFWNTLGSSAGGFAAGYLMLPYLGLHGAVFLLGLGSIGFALALALHGSRRADLVFPAAGLVGLVLFWAWLPDLTRATIRHHLERESGAAVSEVTHLIEGPLTTAFLIEDPATVRLNTGAVQMGRIRKNEVSFQTIAGHMAMIFHAGPDEPRRGLGLCVGSGQSFGAMLRHPIERLDVVEISTEVTRLALDRLASFNNGLGRDPRVRIYTDDARHFVERSEDALYDVVSMEPPPPTSDGAHSLYSVEFYEQVRRVLAPGGVFMQVIQLYYLTPMDTRSILKTMAEVFPNTFVLKITRGDYALLGFAERPTFALDRFRRRVDLLGREWSLRSMPAGRWSRDSPGTIASVDGMIASILMGPQRIAELETPLIYRDDRPLLSYGSGDRWLARRYVGPPLIHLSFTGLGIESLDRVADFFDPPLDPPHVDRITDERVAALQEMNVRDPRKIGEKLASLAATDDPQRRALLAVSLALDHDAALRKGEARRYAEIALEELEAAGGPPSAELERAVRKIVRNRLAVYAGATEDWLASLEGRYAGQALYESMREELDAFRRREAQAASRYLFPRSARGG